MVISRTVLRDKAAPERRRGDPPIRSGFLVVADDRLVGKRLAKGRSGGWVIVPAWERSRPSAACHAASPGDAHGAGAGSTSVAEHAWGRHDQVRARRMLRAPLAPGHASPPDAPGHRTPPCPRVGESLHRPPLPGQPGRRLGGTAVAMSWATGPVPRRRRPAGLALTTTADTSRGAANLLTRPRAGNISSDTRAGVFRRPAT